MSPCHQTLSTNNARKYKQYTFLYMKTPPKGDVDILKRYLKNADSKKRFLTFHILIPVFFLKFLAQASLGKKDWMPFLLASCCG